jgi:hypothetical protein
VIKSHEVLHMLYNGEISDMMFVESIGLKSLNNISEAVGDEFIKWVWSLINRLINNQDFAQLQAVLSFASFKYKPEILLKSSANSQQQLLFKRFTTTLQDISSRESFNFTTNSHNRSIQMPITGYHFSQIADPILLHPLRRKSDNSNDTLTDYTHIFLERGAEKSMLTLFYSNQSMRNILTNLFSKTTRYVTVSDLVSQSDLSFESILEQYFFNFDERGRAHTINFFSFLSKRFHTPKQSPEHQKSISDLRQALINNTILCSCLEPALQIQVKEMENHKH